MSSSPSTPKRSSRRNSSISKTTTTTTDTSINDRTRITVKLRPRAPHYHALLDANGFNPLLMLVVRGRQTLRFIREHVERKWCVDEASRRCVAINAVEFHTASDAAALDYSTSIAQLARRTSTLPAVTVDLFYSWSLKLTPAIVAPTVAPVVTPADAVNETTLDERSKRRRHRSPSPSPRQAPPQLAPPQSAEALSSPSRPFASLFHGGLHQTLPLGQPENVIHQQHSLHQQNSLSSSSAATLARRPERQALLRDDSHDVSFLAMNKSSVSGLFQENHDELDLVGSHSRSSFARHW